jgi:hypothetical protein
MPELPMLSYLGSFPGRARYFSSCLCVQTGSVAHTAAYPTVPRASSPGVKQPDRDTNHPLPPNVES